MNSSQRATRELHNNILICLSIASTILVLVITFLSNDYLSRKNQTYGTKILLFLAGITTGLSIQLVDNKSKSLSLSLVTDKDRFHQLRAHLSSLKSDISVLGTDILGNYLKSIQAVNDGFAIKGSSWSLRAYEKFWKLLVSRQRKFGVDAESCLIARITHVNNIELLDVTASPCSRLILVHQKEFIAAGGVITRILIGPYPNLEDPSAQSYRRIRDQMESVGIEVKYIQKEQGEEYSYDFAWVDNLNYVVKLYSDVGGRSLDKCEILDKVDESIKQIWMFVSDRAQKEDSFIESIPSSRAYKFWDE